MSSTNLIYSLIWIVTVIYFLVSRKSFILQDEQVSKKSQILIIFISVLILLVNAVVFGVGYYKAFNPNYDYAKTSNLVSFHVYKPTYLPAGVEQTTKYYIDQKEFMGANSSVRSAYDLSILTQVKEKRSLLTVISQTQVDTLFDIKSYILSTWVGKEPPILRHITLSNLPTKQVYLRTGGLVNMLVLVDMNNVAVAISSPKASEEMLIEIANSLR